MKKLFVCCLLLLVFIPIYSYANMNVSGIYLKDAHEKEMLLHGIPSENVKILLGNIVVLPEGSYNEEKAAGMIKRLSHIHPNILEALAMRNVKMKLFTGKLTDEPAFSHLQGVKPKGWSSGKTWDDVPGAGGTFIAAAKIGASKKGAGHGSVNLELHEIAHSVENKVFQSLRYDPAYQKVWKSEVKSLFPSRSYFVNYPEEYFAETFAMYYLSFETRKTLQEKAPLTYEYFKYLENKFILKTVETHL